MDATFLPLLKHASAAHIFEYTLAEAGGHSGKTEEFKTSTFLGLRFLALFAKMSQSPKKLLSTFANAAC